LELHSNKSNKVEVLRELSKTLEQGKPKSIAYDNKDASIELMNELNAYCNAVNELIGNSRYSFISAVGKQMQLKRTLGTPPRFQDDSASNWTSAEFSKKMELVTELAVLLPDTGSYQQNPFYGSKLTVFLPFNLETLESDIHRTLETLSAINKLLKDISDSLKLNCPLNKIDAYSICGTAERLSLAPDIKGIKVADNDWLSNSSLISKVISSGISLASIKIRYSSLLTQNFWEQDVQKEYEIFSKYHTKWWRLFSPVYRRSYATLRLICNGTPPKNHEECLKVYEGIIAARQHTLLIAENDSLLCKLFNNYWQGVLSNWDKLTGLLEWILGMHKDVESGLLPENVFQTLDTGIETKNLAKTAELARININTLSDLLKKLTEQLSFIPEGIPGSLFEKSFQELESTLSLWAEQLQKVYSIARLNKMMGELKNSGLSFLAESLFKNEITADKLTPSLEWVYVSALIKRAYSEHPELRDFDSAKHSRRIERFRECDKNILFINQHKLATAAWNKMPGMEQPGQMAIIRHELNKKRKILPIRQLIDQAGEAIRQIKPVFMMSPMSIATFLPPGRISFDVVIFDEASQVKSVDAFGAILRGSQIIVAGDKRQMPPTSFFSREADLEEEENITSDIESILGLFRSRGISERYLRWHYRSRHESLIAVSNVEFYERKLIVFPSAGTSPDAFGLKFNYNPTALFDRGKTRTNREEAKIVAKAIMNHARTRSHLTLGVAAFSVAQRDLIQVELELLRKTDPSVESFFNEHPEEPFFVKNLENIQGDERDVIFISIGYGRNETGKVARNFGPINTTGGERRLNVLITRAKMGLEVFSNFKGDELPVGPEDAHGVRALAHFLKYAETRELDCPEESEREMDSVFEEEVMIALCNKGYQVATQVGTAGYFIDLAIRDPKLPGRFILGIECDGASYHSSKSARDRDRLRQAVLEGLGWRFHRIWSTDWFRNPAGELDRCIVAIQQALESTGNGPVVTNPDTQEKSCTEVLHRTSVVKESVFTPKKYIKAVLPFLRRNDPEIHLAELSELADMIAEVVKTESPVHIEEVTRRLMEVYKISRAGSRVSEAITKAVSYGKRNQLFFKNKDFLYTDNICTASIRDRSEFDTTSRKLEWVAPEEIDSALLKTVELGFSVPAIETLQGAIKFLGFGRMTESMEAMLNKQLKLLIKSGKLNYDGTFVVLGAKDGDAN
jgi:superfamily I DNA and/or RNA helicase